MVVPQCNEEPGSWHLAIPALKSNPFLPRGKDKIVTGLSLGFLVCLGFFGIFLCCCCYLFGVFCFVFGGFVGFFLVVVGIFVVFVVLGFWVLLLGCLFAVVVLVFLQ